MILFWLLKLTNFKIRSGLYKDSVQMKRGPQGGQLSPKLKLTLMGSADGVPEVEYCQF